MSTVNGTTNEAATSETIQGTTDVAIPVPIVEALSIPSSSSLETSAPENSTLRKREEKELLKHVTKLEKLSKKAKGQLMFKIVININRRFMKVKYLNSLPHSFDELERTIGNFVPD